VSIRTVARVFSTGSSVRLQRGHRRTRLGRSSSPAAEQAVDFHLGRIAVWKTTAYAGPAAGAHHGGGSHVLHVLDVQQAAHRAAEVFGLDPAGEPVIGVRLYATVVVRRRRAPCPRRWRRTAHRFGRAIRRPSTVSPPAQAWEFQLRTPSLSRSSNDGFGSRLAAGAGSSAAAGRAARVSRPAKKERTPMMFTFRKNMLVHGMFGEAIRKCFSPTGLRLGTETW